MTREKVILLLRREGWIDHQHNEFSPEEAARIETTLRLMAVAEADMRETCAKACDELEQHWSDYKDAALLNGDVALSNATSGEPRAARFIASTIRSMGAT